MRWLVASRLIWIFSVCLVRIQNNNRYSVKYDILLPSGMIPDFVCHTMYKRLVNPLRNMHIFAKSYLYLSSRISNICKGVDRRYD